ncbi:hypothetical protein [Aeromicrobium sp. Leaf272]|uniref:hypothetical protein n=1 Tax=Aeromicrobium sp. Leaf272 TaxID=1736317 RepID=UPI0006FE20A1|nr:hypothetical protein [Aeromicrobium sp. Leaf272]KQP26179.1 hypothetical protein ASF38_11110 [Aeromicrobium sp. Leaf272]
MTKPLPDTWYSRELPVLRYIVSQSESERPRISAGWMSMEVRAADGSNFGIDGVVRALRALERDSLIQMQWFENSPNSPTVGVMDSYVIDFSAEAYRIVGQWPNPESAADRMIAALEQIAEDGTEDEKTRAQKILAAFAGAGQQIAVGVATAMITGRTG